MIVSSFNFQGKLHIVNEFGDVYRVTVNGPTPIDWVFEHVCNLNHGQAA